MKLWIDDVVCNPDPNSYIQCPSVNFTKKYIELAEQCKLKIELLNIGDNPGVEYAEAGGNFIEIVKWLKETNRRYPIRIHAYNKETIKSLKEQITDAGLKEI